MHPQIKTGVEFPSPILGAVNNKQPIKCNLRCVRSTCAGAGGAAGRSWERLRVLVPAPETETDLLQAFLDLVKCLG